MDSKKCNKIREVVRLQQILKKWKKVATASNNNNNSSSSKGIKFLKRTLSFTDVSSTNTNQDIVPKGFLAVCVGKELKRFIIPTDYLRHQAFEVSSKRVSSKSHAKYQSSRKYWMPWKTTNNPWMSLASMRLIVKSLPLIMLNRVHRYILYI